MSDSSDIKSPWDALVYLIGGVISLAIGILLATAAGYIGTHGSPVWVVVIIGGIGAAIACLGIWLIRKALY